MSLATGLWVAAVLFLVILVPYLVLEIRKGKAHGHTWFTWFKPRGHSDIGPDVGVRYTKPGMDEACGGADLCRAAARLRRRLIGTGPARSAP